MKQVNVVEGQVVQAVEFIWDERHPNTGVTFIDAPDEVEQGWAYSDGIFSPPPPLIKPTEEERQAELAEMAVLEAEQQKTEVEQLQARLAELQGG